MIRSVLIFFACTAFHFHVASHAAAPEDTVAILRDLGYERLSDGAVNTVVRQDQGNTQKLPYVAAYRLGERRWVIEGEDGEWFTGYSDRGSVEPVIYNAFATFEELKEVVGFAPLPKVPEGWSLRPLAHFPEMPTRMVAADDDTLLVLTQNGEIWKVLTESGEKSRMFKPSDYLRDWELASYDISALGITLDTKKRLYVVVNVADSSSSPMVNRVTIFRTAGDPLKPGHPLKPWVRAAYPYGVSAFNHAVSHIAQGRDGMLYVNSGSRTNEGEAGDEPNRSREGEVGLTACIWQIDPEAEDPKISVFARGLRNAYGFCWDDQGRMFATDNGPEKDAPEELNRIVEGGHYGFPYEFSNATKTDPDLPKKPKGLKTHRPVLNLGPAAGGSPEKPLATFDPHSCPAGIIHLDERYPESVRDSFFIVRFGSFKPPEWTDGFDLLNVRLDESDPDKITAKITTFAAPLARPLDICQSPDGTIFIIESLRETEAIKDAPESPPGRVLILEPPR